MANLYTAAQEMTYLDNVVQETLRLHPPAIEYVYTLDMDIGLLVPQATHSLFYSCMLKVEDCHVFAIALSS